MKYQQRLTIKKVDEDKDGTIYLKVYIPKYIHDQLEILLNNRSVRFEKKYIRKINEVKHYKNAITYITKRTENIDTLDISTICNVLLGIETHIDRVYDKKGYYWYMVINSTLDYIEQKLMELDKYFNTTPLIKEYITIEYPTITLNDLNLNLVYDCLDKDLRRLIR